MTWSFSAEMAHSTCTSECTPGIKQLNTAIYQKFPKNDTPVFLKKIQEETYKCINKGSSTFLTLIQCVHISHLLKQINDGYGNVCGKNSANEVTVYTRTRISHFTSNPHRSFFLAKNRVCTLFEKQISRTSPGLRFIFPRL